MRSQKTTYSASVWLALVSVYVVWGSTYLAIRFAIETIPPYFMAGTRFLVSGLILYTFTGFKVRPRLVHWKSAFLVGFFLLVVANGGVSWAEQKVPSGITALLVGTVPLWIVLLQWVRKKTVMPGWKMGWGILLGLTGIVLLVFSRNSLGPGPVDLRASLFLVGTSLAWAYGSLLSREVPLPASPLLSTAMEMIAGGLMQLAVGFFLGEQKQFHFPSSITKCNT